MLDNRILRFIIDDDGYETCKSEIVETIQFFLPRLKVNNIIPALENHDRLPAKTYADIVITINSPHVGICLDSVNSLGAGEGLETVVDLLAPHTVNLHIKDFE